MGGGKGGDFGETKGSFEISADDISNFLALMSVVPGLDSITNLLSIPVDLCRSDYFSALLDLIGVLPIVGEVGDAAKLGDKAVDASKAIKAADKAADAVNTIKNVQKTKIIRASPNSFIQTHKLTLSKKQYLKLLENIKNNGIKEPIKYVEYDGVKYVVDGHHRLRAAKELKLKNIPAEKVSLPYKSYKTIKDLLWMD